MSARSPIGRSYSTNSAHVRHRPSAAVDDAAPTLPPMYRRQGRKGHRGVSSNSSSLVYYKLSQAQLWMDETKANFKVELQQGRFTRDTILRVATVSTVSLVLLRLLVRLLLYSAALDDRNQVKLLIPTPYSTMNLNLEGTVFQDASSTASKQSTPPWSESLPFLPRSIRPRRNNIDYTPLAPDAFDTGRRLRDHDNYLVHHEKQSWLDYWDQQNDWHDAREKHLGDYVHYEEDDYPKERGCYRPKWSYAYRPNCNGFHEVQLGRLPSRSGLDAYAEYISHGFFRETFLLKRENDQDAVLKVLRLHKKKNVNAFVMEQVQLEAVVMGEASGSGLTFEIYGHCGTSVTVERGFLIRDSIFTEELVDQKELDREQVQDIKPRNALTNEQRLRIALTMAESLAVLHGNPKGVIANDDVQIEQWLLDRNGHLKLNDFNNAVIVEWSPEKNDYCMFRRSFNYIYRSPEENNYEWTDERSDVYALGMIYYTLMTGLVPFYQMEDWEKSLEALKRGDKPFVDPRYTNHSIVEAGLVKVMKPCWAFKPQDRPHIFAIVKRLRQVVDLYERKNPGTKIREVDLTNIGYM